VKQGFILGFINGYLPKDLEDILQLFASRRNKHDSSTTVVELKRPIEIHDPVLWLVDWGWNLILSPLSHKVDRA
jgi:hypothetical protein